MKIPIYIASDHAGFQLKKQLIPYLHGHLGRQVVDVGPHAFNPDDDYPDFALALSEKVLANDGSLGILICKNGIGVCIAANKVRGIRAGVGYNIFAARSMRNDDHTNVICIPSAALTPSQAKRIVKTWLDTKVNKSKRHLRRIEKITQIESKRTYGHRAHPNA